MAVYIFIGMLFIFSVMIVISHIVLGKAFLRHRNDWNIWEHKEIYISEPHGFDAELEHSYHKNDKEEIYKAAKWVFDMEPELIEIRDEKDVKLSAHMIVNPESKGIVLLAHGFRSNGVYAFGLIVEWLYNRNYSLLMIDQRAQNESGGKAITLGVKEKDDILLWTEYLSANYPDFPVVLMGVSMGGASVLMASEERMCENVAGIVADCAFTSPKMIVRDFLKRKIGLLTGPFMWSANAVCREKCDFRFEDADTREALKHNTLPVLLFHGTNDNLVPCSMSEENYEIAKKTAEAELVLIDGADHSQSSSVALEKYKEKLISFIDRAVGWK